MVKKFQEFINENIIDYKSPDDIPSCLNKIVNYINSLNIKHDDNKDGRVGSIKDEDTFIEMLKKCDDFEVVEQATDGFHTEKILVEVPKSREWFDIKVSDGGQEYFVNIKSSSLKTFDNVGSVKCITYGLFGKNKPKYKDKCDEYADLFHEFNEMEKNPDKIDEHNTNYYFIVFNKKNNSDCFVTSLLHMNADSIKPNGSNLPFQCNWGYNSKRIGNRKKVAELILKTIYTSLVKSNKILGMEPLLIYKERHFKEEISLF